MKTIYKVGDEVECLGTNYISRCQNYFYPGKKFIIGKIKVKWGKIYLYPIDGNFQNCDIDDVKLIKGGERDGQ